MEQVSSDLGFCQLWGDYNKAMGQQYHDNRALASVITWGAEFYASTFLLFEDGAVSKSLAALAMFAIAYLPPVSVDVEEYFCAEQSHNFTSVSLVEITLGSAPAQLYEGLSNAAGFAANFCFPKREKIA